MADRYEERPERRKAGGLRPFSVLKVIRPEGQRTIEIKPIGIGLVGEEYQRYLEIRKA